MKLYLDYKTNIKIEFYHNVRDMDMAISPFIYLMYKHCRDVPLLKLFLENGASVNDKDEEGWSALVYAIRHNDTELVNLLLSQPDLNHNMADFAGKTPIHHCVNPLDYGSYENAGILRSLSAYFDVNKTDKRGKPAIFYANLQDSGQMVTVLKELGAVDNRP
mmetsp:Transcript_3384/g.2934  ORF Transcript_3384/g.2934 Transcript_3384/m.2934 type:complete len:162 (+) Transcript_3384:1086-1571(+)